ncbi:MAG: phosphotransferase, partial [Roseiflexus sp.]|nr:phosphotransferase [Roseiflexus sp.]
MKRFVQDLARRFAFALMVVALIVLVLGEEERRAADFAFLLAVGLGLLGIDGIVTLSERIRCNVSSCLASAVCTRASSRPTPSPCAFRQRVRHQASEGVTVPLFRRASQTALQYASVSRRFLEYREMTRLRRTALHEVLIARNAHTGQRVVIKRVLPGVANRDLKREAGMLVWLELERVPIPAPRYIDYQERDGRSTLVMTYIEGRTVEELSATGTISAPVIVRLLAKICVALDALHRAGYVHQDIKPANLILEPGGSLAVIDWGSARRIHIPYDPGAITCTPEFASPEQLRGLVLPGNDLYAIGKTLAAVIPAPPPMLAQVIARATGPLSRRYATGADLAHA